MIQALQYNGISQARSANAARPQTALLHPFNAPKSELQADQFSRKDLMFGAGKPKLPRHIPQRAGHLTVAALTALLGIINLLAPVALPVQGAFAFDGAANKTFTTLQSHSDTVGDLLYQYEHGNLNDAQKAQIKQKFHDLVMSDLKSVLQTADPSLVQVPTDNPQVQQATDQLFDQLVKGGDVTKESFFGDPEFHYHPYSPQASSSNSYYNMYNESVELHDVNQLIRNAGLDPETTQQLLDATKSYSQRAELVESLPIAYFWGTLLLAMVCWGLIAPNAELFSRAGEHLDQARYDY